MQACLDHDLKYSMIFIQLPKHSKWIVINKKETFKQIRKVLSNMPHSHRLLLKTFIYIFAEAEASQAQGGKLHTIGLISYPSAVRVSLVVLKLKHDFH